MQKRIPYSYDSGHQSGKRDEPLVHITAYRLPQTAREHFRRRSRKRWAVVIPKRPIDKSDRFLHVAASQQTNIHMQLFDLHRHDQQSRTPAYGLLPTRFPLAEFAADGSPCLSTDSPALRLPCRYVCYFIRFHAAL